MTTTRATTDQRIAHVESLAERAVSSSQSEHKNQRAPIACVRSIDLFGSANEIEIEHGESRYRLRKTLLGKLIMTK